MKEIKGIIKSINWVFVMVFYLAIIVLASISASIDNSSILDRVFIWCGIFTMFILFVLLCEIIDYLTK